LRNSVIEKPWSFGWASFLSVGALSPFPWFRSRNLVKTSEQSYLL